MDTVITISGADRTGASAKILTFLSRKGYGPRDYHIMKSASGATRLQVSFDAARFDRAQLAADIKSLDPAYNIVQEQALTGTAALQAMGSQFPDIAALVQAYATTLADEKRDAALFEAGRKTGAYIYARDWSFGHPLKMPQALRRALVPALEKMGPVKADDAQVTLLDARYCATGAQPHCCEFVSGFMQGFLSASPATQGVRVQKTGCAATGAMHCQYAVSTET